MLRLRIYLTCSLFLGPFSFAKAQDYIAPEGIAALTEQQLLNQIIGNTLSSHNWDEYYEPSTDQKLEGKLTIKHNRYGLVTGTWSIASSLICFNYDKLPLSQNGGCFTLGFDGDKVTYYKTDGTIWYPIGGSPKLRKGNPNNF